MDIAEPRIASERPLEETEVTRQQAGTKVLTLEVVLWLGIALVALFMRLVDLGRWPLSESEAGLALEAWRAIAGPAAIMPAAGPLTGISPLAVNLAAGFFTLFGVTDIVARVPQALAGTALVFSPWLLRPVLGRGHALATSMILLLSPGVLFFSRQLSGEIWAALFAFLLIAGLARWRRWHAPRDARLAAVALGAGLASGTGFYSVVAAAALFLLWVRWRQRRHPEEEGSRHLPPATEMTQYALLALLSFLIASTGFLTNLQGLGQALDLPLQWLSALFGAGPSLVIPFPSTVLLYEMLALGAGIVGGALLAEKRPRWAAFAFIWLAVTVLPASLANSGWAAGLLFVTLPLALLGGAAIARLARDQAKGGAWRVDGLLVGIGLALFIYFWIGVQRYLFDPQPARMLALFLPVVLLLAAAILLWQVHGRAATLRALGLTLLLLASIVSLASGWGLSLVRGADPREPLVTAPSDPDLRVASGQLALVALQRYRTASEMPLAIQRDLGHAPRWYFRDFNVTLVEGGRPDLPEAALLAPDEPAPPGRVGKRVWLGSTSTGVPTESRSLLRWLASRQVPEGLAERSAVLYVEL